jgi:predicted AAA+ superfamily ATPase
LILRTGKEGDAKQLNTIKLPIVQATDEEMIDIFLLLPEEATAVDRLPYTQEFDQIYQQFCRRTENKLSPNEFWHLLLRIRKSARTTRISRYVRDLLVTMNPWWQGDASVPTPKYRRSAFNKLYESLLRGRYPIIALRGPRQVGKTTLQRQMIRDLLESKQVPPKHILRIQFDLLSTLAIPDPVLALINWYEKNVLKDTFNNIAARGGLVYIFLDEIQDMENWSAQLKHIVDHRACRIFLTGSSALRIIAGKESMAGRVQWNEINTLSLAEISTFRHISPLSPYREEIDISEWLKKEFWLDLRNAQWKNGEKSDFIESVYENFCDFGGYPFCHKDKEVTWNDVEDFLFETVVVRTIELDLRAKFESMHGGSTAFMDATLLKNAFRVLCKYTGQSATIEKLCKELDASASIRLKHAQMQMILEFFERSLLVKIIRPFEHRLKNPKESVKVCLCDHAIRKAWLKEDTPLYGTDANADLAGHVVEGIIGSFFKSIKQLGVSYFPAIGKGEDAEDEVDFVLEIGIYHIPVEVKYQNNPKMGQGLKSFLGKEAYNAPFGLVITKGEVSLDHFNDERIIPISAKRLLMLK